jgi:O-antigen/teichoic acid export membrane protein
MDVSKVKVVVVRFAVGSGVNLALRGLTLASKFFLMVYLAKVVSPGQLGVYGLFTITISYALYLLGLDFYTYAQREMFSLPRTEWGGIIRNQFRFYALVYLLVLPLFLLVFVAGWLPWQMAGWFYLLLSFEHLSQELCRLLVALGKVTLANVTLFFRGGAWSLAVVALFWTTPQTHGLTAVWIGWSVGVAVSVVIAVLGVHSVIGPLPEKTAMDWSWVRCGLKVAAQFFVGTLALRGLFTFDRYFLDLYVGKSAVGVYSFYMTLANAMMAFADAGVISRLYPRIVAAYRMGKYDEYRQSLKELTLGIISLYLSFSFALIVVIKPVMRYIGREEYVNDISTLWVLLTAMGLYSLGLVPHYALYARGSDRAITVASLFSFILFIVAAFFLTPMYGMIGVAFSVLVGVLCLGTVKMYTLLISNRVRCSISIL